MLEGMNWDLLLNAIAKHCSILVVLLFLNLIASFYIRFTAVPGKLICFLACLPKTSRSPFLQYFCTILRVSSVWSTLKRCKYIYVQKVAMTDSNEKIYRECHNRGLSPTPGTKKKWKNEKPQNVYTKLCGLLSSTNVIITLLEWIEIK